MEITYYGQSCFQVQLGEHKLLFDPFISPNELASHIDAEAIEADYILVSHAHQDHTADLEPIAKRTNATVISNFEIINYLTGKGIENGHPMNHGGKWHFPFGTVKMVNAIHSSSWPDGTYGGNPAGFIIETPERSFYYAGDTALTMDMKIYGDQHDLDFAFLPIGDNFTMGIEDAVIAASYLNIDKIVGMHYDTFPYIEIDKDQARKIAEEKDIDLVLIGIGNSTNI